MAHLSKKLICRNHYTQLDSLLVCNLSTGQFLLTLPAPFDREPSPPSSPSQNPAPDYVSHPDDFTDDDDGDQYDAQQANQGYIRKSVYDSRIEQILYENPDMPILISDAGKNHEGGGNFIVYTIRTGVYFSIILLLYSSSELTRYRIWKSGDDIPSLLLCDRPLSTSIPRSSCLQSQKNIQWQTTQLNQQRLKRIRPLSNSEIACLLSF